ncbi:putative efflux pump antibiotic resistance protein [Nemania sp. NC0429]|nr:putative efflux pump antibiotic resistance protein [Nemania sp. NC0429]
MEKPLDTAREGGPQPAEKELITWASPDDEKNPKNWTKARKQRTTTSVSAFVLLNTLSSTIIFTSQAEKLFLLSIFLLGFAFGPLLACPLSEVHGCKITLLPWNLLYLIFNTACGAGIGSGIVSDLFTAQERGRAVAVYSIMPLIGPVIGPILGGAFYAVSLLDAVILLPSLFTVEETHEPEAYSVALIRPLKMLAAQPIMQVMTVYNAFLYGLVYILYANFPALWTDVFHDRRDIASLNYLSIFVGSAIPVMPPATIVLASGMLLYRWAAEFQIYWIVPNIGAAIFAAGAFVCAIAVNLYMIFGAIFTIFAPYLYRDLGYGLGLPAALLLWKYGKALRQRSPYALEGGTA